MVGRCHKQNKSRIIWKSVFHVEMLSDALVFYKKGKRNRNKATGQGLGWNKKTVPGSRTRQEEACAAGLTADGVAPRFRRSFQVSKPSSVLQPPASWLLLSLREAILPPARCPGQFRHFPAVMSVFLLSRLEALEASRNWGIEPMASQHFVPRQRRELHELRRHVGDICRRGRVLFVPCLISWAKFKTRR